MRGSSRVYPGALFVVFLEPLKLFRFRSITPRFSSLIVVYYVGLLPHIDPGFS